MRVDYPLGWFRIRRIPIVDEQMQADTYLALGLVSEALNEMVDTFYGPYLIEYLQSMVEHRIVTGYYPRLTLAENQHFASKGGYLVQFSCPGGQALGCRERMDGSVRTQRGRGRGGGPPANGCRRPN